MYSCNNSENGKKDDLDLEDDDWWLICLGNLYLTCVGTCSYVFFKTPILF